MASSPTARWTTLRIVAPEAARRVNRANKPHTHPAKGGGRSQPKRTRLHLALKGTLRKCRHFFMAQGCRVIRKTHRHRVAGYPARVG